MGRALPGDDSRVDACSHAPRTWTVDTFPSPYSFSSAWSCFLYISAWAARVSSSPLTMAPTVLQEGADAWPGGQSSSPARHHGQGGPEGDPPGRREGVLARRANKTRPLRLHARRLAELAPLPRGSRRKDGDFAHKGRKGDSRVGPSGPEDSGTPGSELVNDTDGHRAHAGVEDELRGHFTPASNPFLLSRPSTTPRDALPTGPTRDSSITARFVRRWGFGACGWLLGGAGDSQGTRAGGGARAASGAGAPHPSPTRRARQRGCLALGPGPRRAVRRRGRSPPARRGTPRGAAS